jgi:hypothetical protein
MSVQDRPGWANDPIHAAGGRRHYNSVRQFALEMDPRLMCDCLVSERVQSSFVGVFPLVANTPAKDGLPARTGIRVKHFFCLPTSLRTSSVSNSTRVLVPVLQSVHPVAGAGVGNCPCSWAEVRRVNPGGRFAACSVGPSGRHCRWV